MAETYILKAQLREIVGKKVRFLRRNGQIPAVVYGHGMDSQSITLDGKEVDLILKEAGTSSLVDLIVDGKKAVKVLLHEPQIDPVRGKVEHLDMYAVKMTEKLQTEIPLVFIGATEAVDVLGGSLNTPHDAILVECFPDKLVPEIEVDLSTIKTLDDIIRVSDLKLPEGIEVITDGEEAIVTIIAPRSEEELAELEESPTGEEADQAAVAGVEVTTEKPVDEAEAATDSDKK